MKTLALIGASLLLSGGVLAQNSCLTCHKRTEGSRGGPAHDWPSSVHFANGIACADCHGGDPRSDNPAVAMDPGRGFVGSPAPADVPAFCGKCHQAVRENYATSAHARALASGAGPNCVTCHTAHRQQKVTLDLINEKTCGQCHDYDRAARLKEAMRGVESDILRLTERERTVFRHAVATDEEQKAIFAVRNQAHRLTHVLELNKILLSLDRVRPDLDRVEQRIAAKERMLDARRREGNALAALFFVGMVAAYATHRKLMGRDAGG